MINETVVLLTSSYIEDGYGQQVPAPNIETTLLCKEKSVGRNEYYMAGQSGLKPEIVLIIKKYEYDGQQELIYKDKKYFVERTYSNSFEEIELVCVAVIKNV